MGKNQWWIILTNWNKFVRNDTILQTTGLVNTRTTIKRIGLSFCSIKPCHTSPLSVASSVCITCWHSWRSTGHQWVIHVVPRVESRIDQISSDTDLNSTDIYNLANGNGSTTWWAVTMAKILCAWTSLWRQMTNISSYKNNNHIHMLSYRCAGQAVNRGD